MVAGLGVRARDTCYHGSLLLLSRRVVRSVPPPALHGDRGFCLKAVSQTAKNPNEINGRLGKVSHAKVLSLLPLSITSGPTTYLYLLL